MPLWRVVLFDASDTKARRTVLLDCDGLRGKSGGRAQVMPILNDKAAPDRHGPIVFDERMPVCEARPETKEVVGHRLTMKIVDKPSTSRRLLHPAKKQDDLRVRQVVGEQRRDNNIDLPRRGIRDRIADDPFDALGWRRDSTSSKDASLLSLVA